MNSTVTWFDGTHDRRGDIVAAVRTKADKTMLIVRAMDGEVVELSLADVHPDNTIEAKAKKAK